MSVFENVSNVSCPSLFDGEPSLKKRKLSNGKEERVSAISNQSLSVSDRFLPNRLAMSEARTADAYLLKPPRTVYEQALMKALIPSYSSKTLLSRVPEPFQISRELEAVWQMPSKPLYSFNPEGGGTASNDFYNHPLDWGRNIYFAVESAVWAVDSLKKGPSMLTSLPDDTMINSIKSSPDLNEIAIGNERSTLSLFDLEAQKISLSRQVDLLDEKRATCLAWKKEGAELTVGLTGSILHFDKRQESKAWEIPLEPERNTCSVEWNASDVLLGTGSDANMLRIFDARLAEAEKPIYKLATQAAIKALQWNPNHPEWLAMGTGTGDKHLHLIDLDEKKSVCKENTGFQVCDLTWLDEDHFMVGAGYGSTKSEELSVWRYRKTIQGLKREGVIADVQGGRTLNLVKEPRKDGSSVKISSHCSSIGGTRQAVSVWEVKNIEACDQYEKRRGRKSSSMKSWDVR